MRWSRPAHPMKGRMEFRLGSEQRVCGQGDVFDSGEHAFGIGSPHGGFGVGVGFFDEAVDGGLEVGDGGEHAALEASACELGEEAFDGVEPGRRGWCPARMLGQPFAHLGMLVGGIIVNDGVNILGTCALTALRKRMNPWWRWRSMLRPIAVLSSRAAHEREGFGMRRRDLITL